MDMSFTWVSQAPNLTNKLPPDLIHYGKSAVEVQWRITTLVLAHSAKDSPTFDL